jgi:epoxyqueuosine reductase QueG
MSQDVCPWNVRFAKALPEESPYRPREALAGKDARTLARETLGMTQAEFSRAFSKSPMKRVLRRCSGQAPLRS